MTSARTPLAHLGPLDAEDMEFAVGAHRAAADAAPRHRAGGIGQGDGRLRRHRLQVAALGSPSIWMENKRPSVPAMQTWGDTTRGGTCCRRGLQCNMSPGAASVSPSQHHHSPAAGTAPAGPSATCLLGARLPLLAPAVITLMTLGSGLEKSAVPPRHCCLPKLAPGCPEGWGGGGNPPTSPPCCRKGGSSGMEMAVKLILRGRRGVSFAPSRTPRVAQERAGPVSGCQGKS